MPATILSALRIVERVSLFLAAWLVLVAASSPAHAGAKAVAVTPPGGGQPALAVGFDSGEKLRARVCPTEACGIEGATVVDLPPEALSNVSAARLEPRRIGGGRTAIVVTVPDTEKERKYVVVLASEPDRTEPKVVFQGWTGLLDGIMGERHGPMVFVQGHGIYVGEQQENRTLCGRRTILSPRVLYHETLDLHPAKVQRLDAVERRQAPRLEAEPVGEARGRGLLRATWATSAAKGHLPGALTDGDPATAWVEGRGGAGRGEIASMKAPRDLPLAGFEFVLRPAGSDNGDLAAPETFWIATTDQLYRIAVPEEQRNQPGGRWAVQLPEPVETDCVAIALESAASDDSQTQVAFAEFGAITALDSASAPDLIEALRGDGPTARHAAATLRYGDSEAMAAVAAAFTSLDEEGRRLALDVLDHAPCEIALGAYVEALTGTIVAQERAAFDRLARCEQEAGAALADALDAVTEQARPRLLGSLARIDPARAVRELSRRLDGADRSTRSDYREAIAEAAKYPAAVPAVREALGSQELGTVARIDLLRALGERAAAYPSARTLFERLARGDESFRTRYLLLGVASSLQRKAPSARRFLRRALAEDSSHFIRAQAAAVIDDAGTYREQLMHALLDDNVRVRYAAATTLGRAGSQFAAPGLVRRLQEDDWPLVRAAAADAMSSLGESSALDQALSAALEDSSAVVRRRVILALGERRVTDRADVIREKLRDSEELPAVRSAAARALGMICDHGSLDVLTGYARALTEPRASATARTIGRSAIRALGALQPDDLRERLAPLLRKDVPMLTRQAALAALGREAGSCRPRTEKSRS